KRPGTSGCATFGMKMTPAFRLAVLPDFPEEQWPSMDLCAEMLLAGLAQQPGQAGVRRFLPPYRRCFSAVPLLGRSSTGRNADRLLNRLWWYPRAVRSIRSHFSAFHVVDHSYANLVHALPPERTGVFCHDLDAFRCLLEPKAEPRPRWFKAQARHVLRGLERARVVFHSTGLVRRQIE